MIFLHLSDIHFLRTYNKALNGYNSIFNNMTNPLVQIKKCLDKVSNHKLDFIIITGDLVESGNYEDYKVLKENLDKLFEGIPYIVTLGNHDNKKAFYKGWFNEEEKEESYNSTMEIGGLKIISLDNSEFKNSNGVISLDQCKWLKAELEKEENKDTILLLHHHILEDQFSMQSAKLDDSFEQIIKDSPIIAIFSGHTHHHFKGKFAEKPYFTSGSLSFAGYDEKNGLVRFEEATSCNLCTYENGKISVEAIDALDEPKLLAYVDFKC